MNSMKRGFTIVELLIVVVVIAVLAAVTLVAYSGIRERAVVSALQSDLTQAAKTLEIAKANDTATNKYPSSLTGLGLTAGNGASYDYTVDPETGQNFCLTVTVDTTSYHLTEAAKPAEGECGDDGLVAQLSASAITGVSDGSAISTWADSVGGYDFTQATSANQPVYRQSGPGGEPSLQFDGVNDYLVQPGSLTVGGEFTLYARVYSTEATATYRNIFERVSESNPMVWFDTAGKIEFDMGSGNRRTAGAYRNAWTNVAISHAAGTSPVLYYVNGVRIVPSTTSNINISAFTPSWFNRGGAQTWLGYVSDIRIYDRQLSASEIGSL